MMEWSPLHDGGCWRTPDVQCCQGCGDSQDCLSSRSGAGMFRGPHRQHGDITGEEMYFIIDEHSCVLYYVSCCSYELIKLYYKLHYASLFPPFTVSSHLQSRPTGCHGCTLGSCLVRLAVAPALPIADDNGKNSSPLLVSMWEIVPRYWCQWQDLCPIVGNSGRSGAPRANNTKQRATSSHSLETTGLNIIEPNTLTYLWPPE